MTGYEVGDTATIERVEADLGKLKRWRIGLARLIAGDDVDITLLPVSYVISETYSDEELSRDP